VPRRLKVVVRSVPQVCFFCSVIPYHTSYLLIVNTFARIPEIEVQYIISNLDIIRE
jgi:hypothetical protein